MGPVGCETNLTLILVLLIYSMNTNSLTKIHLKFWFEKLSNKLCLISYEILFVFLLMLYGNQSDKYGLKAFIFYLKLLNIETKLKYSLMR